MDSPDQCASRLSRKRKFEYQEDDGTLDLDDLNQDLLEKVLSWLPTSAFFRLTSVCKRWKSVADSTSFKLACSEIPSRQPWFFMVGSCLDKSVVFDSTESKWKQLNHPSFLRKDLGFMPVASSGGLICFRNASGDFIVSNPMTGSFRELPHTENQTVHAIVMQSSPGPCHSFELVLVCGEFPRLSFKTFNSALNRWGDANPLSKNHHDSGEIEEDAVYFLSKAGNLVSTNMLRSPSKQYSSVTTMKNGNEIVYFLSSSGAVVACDLTSKCFSEYPRLLPIWSEYSIDIVECRGEMIAVVLSEFFESASLRMWRYDEGNRSWQQVMAMPPAMAHEFYGKKVDINCLGAGDRILICLNSSELFRYILYDSVGNEWTELPTCDVKGEVMEFMSAFSFEPRIEASV
ncbi:F-box only protein 13 [Rhodamnia argentea]|uniref:F-box only protein 13 n=1 Tax=Rhodamnia argentea TaxID=178133 RepID=A0A8B8P750_9MYRT|nr:F-box only protein 13 [Rhodamnia argentea]